jgi:hypothetical protein
VTPIFVPYGNNIRFIYLWLAKSFLILLESNLPGWRCLQGGRSPTGKHLHPGASKLSINLMFHYYYYNL